MLVTIRNRHFAILYCWCLPLWWMSFAFGTDDVSLEPTFASSELILYSTQEGLAIDLALSIEQVHAIYDVPVGASSHEWAQRLLKLLNHPQSLWELSVLANCVCIDSEIQSSMLNNILRANNHWPDQNELSSVVDHQGFVQARYFYHCDDLKKFTQMHFSLFQFFPKLRDIKVRVKTGAPESLYWVGVAKPILEMTF